MDHKKLTLAFVVVALIVGVDSPMVVSAASPSGNPGQPLEEILTTLQGLDAKLDSIVAEVAKLKSLDQIPPTWSKKLPASERFGPVLDGNAVLDRETGLVWEKSPDTTAQPWSAALFHCYRREVGERKGWRLPTVEELTSLIDPGVPPPDLTLPSGHPFAAVQSSNAYWSATTDAGRPTDAWIVWFLAVGFNPVDVRDKALGSPAFVWCVRGGHGYDGSH